MARNSTNSTSPRRRGPVQCRCSVGSERAPASHACLARARASSVSEREDLLSSPSLASPFFSRYICRLSVSYALTHTHTPPLLREAPSPRINLYKAKPPHHCLLSVRNCCSFHHNVCGFFRSLSPRKVRRKRWRRMKLLLLIRVLRLVHFKR